MEDKKIQNTLFRLSGNGSAFMTCSAHKIQVLCLLERCRIWQETLAVARGYFWLMHLHLGCNKFQIWLQKQTPESWERVIKTGAPSPTVYLQALIPMSLWKRFAVVFMFNYHHLPSSTPLMHVTLMWITRILLHVLTSLLKCVGQWCCLLF